MLLQLKNMQEVKPIRWVPVKMVLVLELNNFIHVIYRYQVRLMFKSSVLRI